MMLSIRQTNETWRDTLEGIRIMCAISTCSVCKEVCELIDKLDGVMPDVGDAEEVCYD